MSYLKYTVVFVLSFLFCICSFTSTTHAAAVIDGLSGTYQINGSNIHSVTRKAIRFQTGPAIQDLDTVKIVLCAHIGTEANAETIMELREDDGSANPTNTILTTLNPNPLTGTNFGGTPTVTTFTPAGVVTLLANTRYWIVVRGLTGTSLNWAMNDPNQAPSNGTGTYLGYRWSWNSGSTWNNTSTYCAIQINAPWQVKFTKKFMPDSIGLGDTSTLTFTLSNTGGSNPATALDFTDNMPAGLVIATPSNASTTCTGGTLTAIAGTGTISYTGGTLGAGATCTITVDVTTHTGGNFANTTGNLTSSLGNSGTATDTLTVITPIPTLSELGMIIFSLILGGTAIYTIRRRNDDNQMS